ncbi:MAG: bile acid:sodium symporter family protein, partial [Elusimicrobiota bacterium]
MEKINKFCNWFSKQLIIWVVFMVAAGYLFPGILIPMKSFSDWLFAFTMLGIGMVLSPDDFAGIYKKPVPVFLGSLAQFLIMPALGFIIGKLLRLEPNLALGLIIAGAVPDAMAAGVISYLADAAVAFSISLTTLTTLVSPVATPAFTYYLGSAYIPVQFLPMFFSIIKIVILPLLIGILIKKRFEKTINEFTPVFPAFSTVFIGFICGLVTAINKNYLSQLSPAIFIAVILHNIFGLILGYFSGKLFGFDEKYCRTLSIGVGMQNAGLGAVLSIKHFSNETAIP